MIPLSLSAVATERRSRVASLLMENARACADEGDNEGAVLYMVLFDVLAGSITADAAVVDGLEAQLGGPL